MNKAKVIELARDAEQKELAMQNAGAMNTPTDVEAKVEAAVRMRILTDQYYAARKKYADAFNLWEKLGYPD